MSQNNQPFNVLELNEKSMLDHLPSKYHPKIQKIASLLKNKSVVVAFSGGIDSSLMVCFAKIYAKQVLAIIIDSPMTPKQEILQANSFAKDLQIPLEKVFLDTLKIEEIMRNAPDRCYFCKKEILATLIKIQKARKMDLLVDGTNFSDLELPRAGLKALKESTAISPLALAQISKEDIIEISHLIHLPSADVPSQACLASRIPFNIPLRLKLLQMINDAESSLRTLLQDKTHSIRVRIHPIGDEKAEKYLARIELADIFWEKLKEDSLRNAINQELSKLGFQFIAIDLNGFSSGSMHKLL